MIRFGRLAYDVEQHVHALNRLGVALQILVGRQTDVKQDRLGVVRENIAWLEVRRHNGVDDLDLVFRVVSMLQDAALGRVRYRNHSVASLQWPIQPNFLHQPSLPSTMFLQKPVVMDCQHRFASPQEESRKVDVTRDVNDFRVEASRF